MEQPALERGGEGGWTGFPRRADRNSLLKTATLSRKRYRSLLEDNWVDLFGFPQRLKQKIHVNWQSTVIE